MCSGRVDPVMMIEAFISGADGVFIGACRRGECHYSTGNLHAEGRVELVSRILEVAGINKERIVMRMMSSAEGNKFAEFATEFQERISKIGPIGESEGLSKDDIEVKLRAARDAVGGRKLRWVAGKIVEFKEKGNLYNEVFTAQEIRRLLEEVTMDEYRLREIILRMSKKPESVKSLAAYLGVEPRIVVRQIADLQRMGLLRLEKIDGRTPLWTVIQDKVACYE